VKKVIVLMSTVVVALGTAVGPARAATFIESFETGFGGWQPDTDGKAPAWSVTRTTEQAYHGRYSVRLWMDGTQDDGTTWVERRFAVAPNAKVSVQLSFQLWSPQQARAGHWNVVATAAGEDPEGEGDFEIIGHTEEAEGWKPYARGWVVTADATGGVWVAFGTSVIWEVNKHHYLDYVQVTIAPVNG
jgi:hypothetical protein